MTTLSVNLTPTLQTTLQQPGVWAYAVYFDSTGPVWNPLVENGQLQTTAGALDIALPTTFNGGKVYFLIQSQDSSQPYDLTTLITGEDNINWTSAQTYDFRYDSFEVSLLSAPGDAGNLTSVEGFGLPMSVAINYSNGTSASVGYGITGSALFQQIADIDASKTYVYDYTSGPLAGDPRAGISPSQAVGLSPPNPAFQASDWDAYIQSLENTTAASAITLAGYFNGAPDANGIYHNEAFFSYQLQWDASENVFWLAPTESSNVKGYIKITPDNLADSIYSTLGTVEIYTNQTDTTPYQILGSTSPEMNTGLNNQWGEVLTQFLTGFTAGYYGTTGASPNGAVTTPIDLNANWNWDPTYAFGHNLSSAQPVYMDPYSEIYFYNSNSYGSGYSDNLMRQYSVGGPLISVWDSQLGTDVNTISLTIFDDSEQPTGYTTPVLYNYIAPVGGSYGVPTYSGDGTNMVMTFANHEMVLVEDTPIVLRIYAGMSGGVAQWNEVTIQAASGETLWQNWNLTYDAGTGTYAASAVSGSSQPAGSLLVNNLPKPQDGTAWYQIVVGTGDAAKTYNLYANVTGGELENPAYAGQEGSLAIDGLALATPSASTAQTISTFSLSFLYGGSTSIDPALLEQNTAASYVSTRAVPFAPVAGTLDGGTFTAEPDQDNATTNAVTVSEGAIAFGWTGTNTASGTASWISGYTNKVGALNWGVLSLVEAGGGTTFAPLGAQADIDGQWTSVAATLGNGTYTVTMTEYAQADTGFTTPLGPQSSALTLTVDLSDLQIQTTAGNALKLLDDASATAGNWLRFEVQSSSLPHSTSVLLYVVNAQGELVARDGETGAGVTLEDAVIGTLGAAVSDAGATLFNGSQMVYLGLGQELRFALQTGDAPVNLAPTFSATVPGDGTAVLNVGGVHMLASVDNTLTDGAELAAPQRAANEALTYLTHGATLDVEVAGSCANTNQLAFVKVDVNPATGTWSVNGVAYGDTPEFHAAVLASLDAGYSAQHGGGTFQASSTWTVSGSDGYYVPVLVTQSGAVFLPGQGNSGGHEYIQMYGENTFGFEDLTAAQGSDFDYNDMVMHLVPHL
ncbi:hypothetical protein J5J86_20610 [Aquabacter sp. L1I39]|uniref:hypothetical protein n=1 Tax=Aquabacter sp. L1I39 TaxID=2820278 RepID=UPI001ADB15C1|nr:hypothetical protein [Aquabacter sp. L1I39]QTL03131.1 hypothetical protein J5J86_20610 [Aquabacter sp. L1I39]